MVATAYPRSRGGCSLAVAVVAREWVCEQRVLETRSRARVVHDERSLAVARAAGGHDADVRTIARQPPDDEVAGPPRRGILRQRPPGAAPREVGLQVRHA